MVTAAILLIFLTAHCLAAGPVDKQCSSRLSQLDPHMSTYIGKTYTLTGKHTDKSYTYDVGICVDPAPQLKPGCAVVQTDTDDKGNSTTRCAGNTTGAQVARSSDGVWIELTYTGGSSYHNHCGGVARTARIVFLCDPNVRGEGSLDFLEENNHDNLCYYLFSVAGSAVCGKTPTVIDAHVHKTLSIGDVCLIMFACLVIVWLVAMVIGFLYKRFFMGAKGWEQIPMAEYYKEFGNLEADGCDFICRSRHRKAAEYMEPTFGADTDEEEEEDEDNLLPM